MSLCHPPKVSCWIEKKGTAVQENSLMLLLLLPASVHVRVKSINMKGKQTCSQASAHFWTLHKQPGTLNKKKVRNKANPSKKKRNSSCILLAKKTHPRKTHTFWARNSEAGIRYSTATQRKPETQLQSYINWSIPKRENVVLENTSPGFDY